MSDCFCLLRVVFLDNDSDLSAWLSALWSIGHYQIGCAITVTVLVLGYKVEGTELC